MKHSRITKLFGGILLSASFLVTACGGGDNGGDANRIIFWHTFGQDIANTVQNKIDEFEEIYEEANNVDIQIDFECMQRNHISNIPTRIWVQTGACFRTKRHKFQVFSITNREHLLPPKTKQRK